MGDIQTLSSGVRNNLNAWCMNSHEGFDRWQGMQNYGCEYAFNGITAKNWNQNQKPTCNCFAANDKYKERITDGPSKRRYLQKYEKFMTTKNGKLKNYIEWDAPSDSDTLKIWQVDDEWIRAVNSVWFLKQKTITLSYAGHSCELDLSG